jgi:hypothetical protein
MLRPQEKLISQVLGTADLIRSTISTKFLLFKVWNAGTSVTYRTTLRNPHFRSHFAQARRSAGYGNSATF